MPANKIWQVDAYRRTAQDAVREFADTYWGKPRRTTQIDKGGFFSMVNGVAEYAVALNSEATPPVYEVSVIQG